MTLNPMHTSFTMTIQNTILASAFACALLPSITGCGSGDDGPAGTIAVQISGEDAATDGFLFPSGSEVTFADGWELKFSHVLVTVGAVTISSGPNRSPSDQSATDGPVARKVGPWAVDLSVEGSVLGAGGEGKATPLTTLDRQNLKGDQPFADDEQYAFGYDIVAASDDAMRVNVEGEAESSYQTMIAAGYSVMYVGTATFQGDDDCESSDTSYDFAAIPAEIPFELGFRTPTAYVNCQNQENEGEPFPDEEFPRGIALRPNQAALAQITLHLEHPWFSSVVHDSELYFDQMAARLVGRTPGETLTLEDLVDVDPTAFTDALDQPLPWRVCSEASLNPGQRGFDPGDIPIDPDQGPAVGLRDYRDYVQYIQSTQGHLNGGEGLCFIERNYPSPE
jgi:hypothetical protein